MRHQNRVIRRVVCVVPLLVVLFVSACGGSSSTSTSSTPSTNIVTGTPPPQTPAPSGTQQASYKGVYQFIGQKNSANAALPYLAGAALNFYWSDIEPAKGQFNWSVIDTAMAPWTSHGKHVILRITAAGNNNGDASSAQRTPQWVFDEGVPSVKLSSGAVYPQYWNATWLKEFGGFIQALAAHYDGNPAITYVNIATGNDGETIPIKVKNPQAMSLIQGMGYTDELWFNTIQRIAGLYTASFHKTPLAMQIDRTFIGGTAGYNEGKVISFANSLGIWLQCDSLNQNTSLGPPWTQRPLAVEQGQSASQSGYPLSVDLQQGLSLHASFILIFVGDINNAANQGALQSAATQIVGG